MKRILMLVLLALALPMAAFATNSVDFTNAGGTLSGSSAGLSLSGSELIAVNGLNGLGLVTGDLGSVSFTTGGLTSGNLQMGGTFGGGGSFVIDGNGTNGIPSGAIFSGTFDGPVTWTLVTLAYEWSTGDMPSHAIRAAAGIPIGLVAAWLVVAAADNQVN